MSSERRQQKKAEQKKKQRALLKKQDRKTSVAASSPAGLSKLALSSPVEAAYISRKYAEEGNDLLYAIVTRKITGVGVVAGTALVDRVCLGVKNGMVLTPERWPELRQRLAADPNVELIEADLLVVQSVVFHAIDYAKSLGFGPHRDFPEGFFGPRPAQLLDTPLAYPKKPFFVSGPYDNTAAIMRQLSRVAGVGNFDYLAEIPGTPRIKEMFDEAEEDSLDHDVVDTEGEEVV